METNELANDRLSVINVSSDVEWLENFNRVNLFSWRLLYTAVEWKRIPIYNTTTFIFICNLSLRQVDTLMISFSLFSTQRPSPKTRKCYHHQNLQDISHTMLMFSLCFGEGSQKTRKKLIGWCLTNKKKGTRIKFHRHEKTKRSCDLVTYTITHTHKK